MPSWLYLLLKINTKGASPEIHLENYVIHMYKHIVHLNDIFYTITHFYIHHTVNIIVKTQNKVKSKVRNRCGTLDQAYLFYSHHFTSTIFLLNQQKLSNLTIFVVIVHNNIKYLSENNLYMHKNVKVEPVIPRLWLCLFVAERGFER